MNRQYQRARSARAVSSQWLPLIWAAQLTATLWSQPGNVAWAQQAARPLTAPTPLTEAESVIPKSGFKSWSLFLVCDPSWLEPQSDDKIQQLQKQFLAFGKAIGLHHVAVWFLKPEAQIFKPGVPAKVHFDVERAMPFCNALKLPLKEGPYLLLSTRYPGRAVTGDPDTYSSDFGNHFILSLNGVSAEDTTQLLLAVARHLAGDELQNLDSQSEQYLQVWKRAFEGLLVGTLSKVSLTLDTGVSSTSIAQPSANLLESLKSPKPTVPVQFGSKLIASKAGTFPTRLVAFLAGRTDVLFEGPPKDVYTGTFAVALQNLDAQGDRSALEDPIVINVRAPGASKYLPARVTVSRLQEWVEVELFVPDPRAPKILVSASSGPGDSGGSVELDVIRPRVVLSTANVRVLGWGLGTTEIAVTARGIKSPAGVGVSLTSEGGNLQPASVKLDASGTGVTTLRSDSSPAAIVHVVDPDLSANALNVAFQEPFLFLVAAISGGLIGAFLRGRGRRKWPNALAIGALSAVLMTVGQAVGFTSWVATALGTNIVATSGEAVIFFLGAVAALVGVSALIPKVAKQTKNQGPIR